MRCCKSQNRKRKRDGTTGYDEHQNALVCKKHSVHDRLQRNSPSPNQMPYELSWKERVPVRLLGWLQLAPVMELNRQSSPEAVMRATATQTNSSGL